MPKMKTKSSAKKRFKVTGKGKVVAKSAFTSHMMMNKSRKMKRKAKGTHLLATADARVILKNYLPYSRKLASKGINQEQQQAEG